MAIVAEKTDKLIKAFTSGAELSIDDIKSVTDSRSKQSVYNYLEACKDAGLSLDIIRKGHKVFYKLKNTIEDIYPLMSKEDVEKFLILEWLRSKGIWKKSDSVSTDYMYKSIIGDDSDNSLLCGRTHFYELVAELKDTKQLMSCEKIVDGNRYNHYWLPNQHEDVFSLEDFNNKEMNTWRKVYSIICSLPDNHPYNKQLNKVKSKLGYIFGDPGSSQDSESYVVYGRAYHGMDKYDEAMNILEKYDYKHRALHIQLKSKEKFFFKLGYVIYAMEQDCIYLLGQTSVHPYSNNKKKVYRTRILRIEKIEAIEETNIDNDYYCSDEASKYVSKMYGATEDTIDDNTVRFSVSRECTGNKLIKLKRLADEVNGSFGLNDNDDYEFCGEVIGRGNLLRLLRQYGNELISINQDYYRKELVESANKTLKHYKEFFDGEE